LVDEPKKKGKVTSNSATVMFRKPPGFLQQKSGIQEWTIGSIAHIDPIIDTHFIGLTPLNCLDEAQHRFESVFYSFRQEFSRIDRLNAHGILTHH